MSLSIRHLSFSYNKRELLNDFSLEVASGQTMAIVGPSGSGKSTLLRLTAGLLVASHGEILINGINVSATPTHLRSVGLVFQDNQLFTHLNVFNNVAFGLKMAHQSRSAIAARCDELLNLVGLTEFSQQSVSTLSGGQAKRVALARALAPKPQVLLLDEPLTGLDDELHDRLATDLRQILQTSKTTALLVTHDLAEARTIADTITHLQ
ncbi:MAG: ABC transporter ATP-binding protein [Actinomycetes bacterium]